MGAHEQIERRRKATLLCIRGVTDKALHKILQELRGGGALEASLWDANSVAGIEYDDEVALQLQLPLVKGSELLWDICRPSALVQQCVRKSAAMRRLFARAPSSPVSPGDFILAHDEVTPGAVLRPHNKRKLLSFYASFVQVGHHAIRKDNYWFPIGIIRSVVLDTVEGGVSCALRMMLRAMLLGDGGNFTQGISLDLDDGTYNVLCSLSCALEG